MDTKINIFKADTNRDYIVYDRGFSASAGSYREELTLSVLKDGKKTSITTTEAVVSFKATPKINTTMLVGFRGTAKEYVSHKDYEITITGSFHGHSPNDYPVDKVYPLLDILKSETSIDVVSEHLRMAGINSMVVTEYSMEQSVGCPNRQTYTIKGLSDDPIEVHLADESDKI